MKLKCICMAAVLTATICAPTVTLAGAGDFTFEPVKTEVKKGDDVTVAVRLTDKRTGKPVPDAVIVQSRIDMGPDGMAEMLSKLTPLPSPAPGVYAFKTDLSMPGRWLLNIAVKVQGEPETVTGKVTFKAVK